MTERIENQIERFAPVFHDRVLARHVMPPAELERNNANLVGGDINGGTQDFGNSSRDPRSGLIHTRLRCRVFIFVRHRRRLT